MKQSARERRPAEKARPRFFKALLRLLLAAVCAAGLCAGALFGYRAVLGWTHRIGPPGIDEMAMVRIGGIDQSVYIRGRHTDNPVLLLIHGGPGMPIQSALHRFQYAWEDAFTVVEWDQRLSGKTYFASDPELVLPTASFERSCADAWELVRYLQDRLGKKRIVIMGHSWGSSLGSWLAATHPEAVAAYIGVGQAVNLYENERLGFETALAAARSRGRDADVAALLALEPYPVRPYAPGPYYAAEGRLRAVQRALGLYTPQSALANTLSGLTSPYYSLRELSYFTRDDIGRLHESENRYLMEQFDLHDVGLVYSVPVFYIQGEKDIVTATALVTDFYEQLQAPVKALYVLPNAAHVPMVEAPEAFTGTLKEKILPLIRDWL